MGRNDGRCVTEAEWAALWASPDATSAEEGESYVLPKVYPGKKIRCPNCGCWQGNEAVLDTYRWCMRCSSVLQDPSALYWNTPPASGPFCVVAASYGHPRDPKLAFDVRSKLQTRVGVSDRLEISAGEDLAAWLGNPCPGVKKCLRVRYVSLEGVTRGRRREVWLQEHQEGRLRGGVSLRVPTSLPLVIVFSAQYGSPTGASRGRGTFDVTEFMQGRVDRTKGKFLSISKSESLTELFGDPCPGKEKCLHLHYEILGTEGKAEALESDGHLLTPISISCTPMLAPLIMVESATYGQTPGGIDGRLQTLQRDISDLLSIQNRKDLGLPRDPSENKRLLRLRPLISELESLQALTPRHVDVTVEVQKRVEDLGGGILEFAASRDDLNALFGNPLPGQKKQLRIRYLVVGHDSERQTSLEEVTTSGYPRNFILQRKGCLDLQVNDDRAGRGVLEEDVLVDSPKVLPVVEVLNSSYGHPRNGRKTFDISTKLRSMINRQGGEKLVIDCETDLLKLFDEPCRGIRKIMKISYVARGLHGRIRVAEKDHRLLSDIIVGYYDRDKFKTSELLPKRYGLAPLSPSSLETVHADGRREYLYENSSHAQHHETSTPARGKDEGEHCGDAETAPQSGARPVAIAKSKSRRERRRVHQEMIQRKEAEKESQRRRLQVRKESEVRRARRRASEAAAEERALALEGASGARSTAPLVMRLLDTLNKRSPGAAATANVVTREI